MFRSAIDTLWTKSTLRALRHRNYALAEIAGWFSGAGTWFYRIGIQVLTWELTHSGLWLGVIALAEAAPGLLFAPIAGAFADRHDRLAMARIVQIFMMSVTALLAAMTLAGWVHIWLLLPLALLHGTSAAFWVPVRMAIMPNLVPREDISAAIALHATLFNLARFLGPAAAAPILSLWGAGAAFAINALTYLVYLVVLYMIELVNPDRRAEAGRGMVSHLLEGLAYVSTDRALKFLFLHLIFTTVFLRAYMELLPGLSETLFGYDPDKGVAILVSAAGLGAIASSLLVGNIVRLELLLRAYFIGTALALLFLTLFAATSYFWFAVGCAVFLSGAQIGMNVAGQVMVQTSIRGDMRGRVMSLWGLMSRSGPALGAVVLGWLATTVGFRWPVLAAAAITAVVSFYVAGKWGVIARALKPPAAEPAPRRAAE